MSEQIITTKPYSTTFKHLADVKDYVGKELGLTEWIEVTQKRINNFADTTEDHQWIHIDPEMSAKYSPYKTTIAHGFLVLSLASKMTYETYKVEDVTMGVNYGLDKVRFPNATPVGALIRGRVSLLSYKEIPNGAQYVVKVVFELKGQEKPACVAEFVARAYAGPSDQPKPEFNKKPVAKSSNGSAKKEEDAVLYEKENHVAIITLNRPERYNAANDAVAQGVLSALQKVRSDEDIRTVILTGKGKGFCAGADLQGGFKTPEEARLFILNAYAPIVREIMALPKIVIAAINGPVAGVGCAFALACDLRIMAESSNIRYAFINIGLGPDGGAGWLLNRIVGYAKALEIAVEGEKIPAKVCLKLGLTNKVASDDTFMDDAKAWAHRLAERPPMGVAITKKALQHAVSHNLTDTIAFEADQQVAALGSDDFREGVTAFFEKENQNLQENKKMSQLLFIRHAQASLLKADYDQLSDLGFQQSELLGSHLAEQKEVFDKIYVGPLKRHWQTMDTVKEAYQKAGLPWPTPIEVPELAEHLGPETMRVALPELIKHDNKLNLLSREVPKDHISQKKVYLKMFDYVMELWAEGAFEVPEIQTWKEFRVQVKQGLEKITAQEENGLKIAAFTSGGTTAAAVGHALGMNSESKIVGLNSIIQNTSITRFLFSRNKITLKSFNHVPHLVKKEMITFV